MSENKTVYGIGLEVTGFEPGLYPEDDYVLGRNERGSAEEIAIDFMGPCLGLLGYDSDQDVFHGAHTTAASPNKINDFMERYDPDKVIVSGLNYNDEDVRFHEGSSDAVEVLQESPREVYRRVVEDGRTIDQISALEDVLTRRGSIESFLEESDAQYETAWAEGTNNTSIMTASAPEKTVTVMHGNLASD